MSSIGERLRGERETRDTSIEEMAVATGIGQSYLEALERNEIDALPGPAFGKLYIRAYAEILGFDAQPWVEDYDREQRRARSALAETALVEPSRPRPVADAIARWKAARLPADEPVEAVEPIGGEEPVEPPEPVEIAPEEIASETPAAEPVVPPDPIPEPAVAVAVAPSTPQPVPTRVRRRTALPLLASAIAIVLVAAIYIGTRGRSDGSPVVQPPSESRPPEPSLPAVVAKQEAPPPETPPKIDVPSVRPIVTSSPLTVSEFGLGQRVVGLRLEGEGDRFDQGTRVSFASRVLGGRRGDVVRHVWIYEGRTEQTISLRLGGADFRTHSNKTLGKAGSWAVEARDREGTVLARVAFTCTAR